MPERGQTASDASPLSGRRRPGALDGQLGVRLGAAAASEQAEPLRLEGRFGARAHVELAVDLLHIVRNRVARKIQLDGDLRQRVALGDAQKHLVLAIGQDDVGHVARPLAGRRARCEMRHDAARDRRRQGRLALAHAPELVDDHGFRLVFQDVAEGAGLERGEEVIVVVMDGDDHRLRLRLRFPQRDDDVDARSVGEPEVDQGDVDLLLGDDRQGAVDRDASKNTGSANTSATCTLSQALASGTSSNNKMFVMRTSVCARPGGCRRAGRDDATSDRASNVRTQQRSIGAAASVGCDPIKRPMTARRRLTAGP